VKIRIANTRIGRFNSGIDLSGEIMSPHLDGDGISEEFSIVEFLGQE
jgi:hypothetical protein